MEKQTVKEFAVANRFSKVFPTYRVNENGYLYVTFMEEIPGQDARCENIYLSKGAQEGKSAGDAVVLSNFEIAHTVNAKGEPRIKLCRVGEGSYVSIDALL